MKNRNINSCQLSSCKYLVMNVYQSLRILSKNAIQTRMFSVGPVQNSITNKLKTNLNTTYLEVINESYMHNVPEGSETHFKVVVVSEIFKDLPLLKRHRLVNNLLKEELQSGVHALSIVAKTPEQWSESDKVVETSPNCRGGFGK